MSEFSALRATLARTGAPRIASFIVTIWGDAVTPRGGSLWLGSLQAILDRFGCSPGQVRTAMSRLTEEGWLARNRLGRNSFYRLGPRGEQVFAAAAARIYAAGAPDWDGRFRLVLLTDAAMREALQARGFGSLPGGAMIGVAGDVAGLPKGVPVIAGAVRDQAEAQLLVARAWPLEALGVGYRRFLDAFGPLRGACVAPEEALPLRLLLVHEWRRLVLRDPLLPAALLPEDWAGGQARDLAGALYRRLDPDAEAWLDAEGRNEAGLLPPSAARDRFAA
ncbi:phenylacetic acid degradation operon negative regulatory protein PaaX [Falsiroseomonas bella]|uniref:Phenylacetic acid degradation operon negative regulatory protein PaaX n=1 Tax=Falsiroseomonas bella TaxID=2184016 RepID=A0A317FHX4_9PROT|nr:PaaX family transcriptional regulator C-terminal domain-containing protein [Falsiroseomonas bella]PWS38691.1 phenylacetic acid degradation operon negative regulatory protein PaaX [Falsiroseomonas bella]